MSSMKAVAMKELISHVYWLSTQPLEKVSIITSTRRNCAIKSEDTATYFKKNRQEETSEEHSDKN